MHEGALAFDDELGRRLIGRSFPETGGMRVHRVPTTGTVNRIVRVGDELVARFPLLPALQTQLEAEATALTELASAVPFPAPLPRGIVPASEGFASAWSMQTWLEGTTADPVSTASSLPLAHDAVTLIRSLRAVDTRGRSFDGSGRGGVLADHDDWVAECLDRSTGLFDTTRARELWTALRVVPRAVRDTMSHRDLTPFNLLVDGTGSAARLIGVLDGGSFGPADPALDLVSAWHLFDAPARRVVREGVAADDDEWLRGAGWALQQALGLGWYYAESNPEMSALGISTVRRLLGDPLLTATVRSG